MNKTFVKMLRAVAFSIGLATVFCLSSGLSLAQQQLDNKVYNYRAYAYLNPDLVNAYRGGSISRCLTSTDSQTRLLRHWVDSGINEGRQASLSFRAPVYRQLNPDLSGLSNRGLINHYVDNGAREGRQASWVLDPAVYRASNSDLASFDNIRLINHYLSTGAGEARRSSNQFDVRAYREFNADLRNLSNSNLVVHYLVYGRREGRRAIY